MALGLGDQMLDEDEAAVADLVLYPEASRVIGPVETRKKNPKTFRYRLLYRSRPGEIVVSACMHLPRDDDAWRDRL